MRRFALSCAAVGGCAWLLAAPPHARAAEGDAWALPAAGGCQGASVRAADAGESATQGFPFRTGDAVASDRLASLARFFPRAVWEQREVFFHEGMRLEIGTCFRDYCPPPFFQEATARGGARLTPDGGLEGWRAGLPFAPATIRRDDADAARKWAWNAALRYHGAGFRGKFRILDLTGGAEESEAYAGEIFAFQITHRADAPGESGESEPLWVAGGHFTEPFDAREFAWRQYRSADSLTDADESDDVQAYVPQLRRVRRMPAARVDGLFVPAFSVGAAPDQQLAVPSGGGIPATGGVGAGGGGGGGSPSSGGSGGGGSGAGAAGAGGTAATVGADVARSRTGFDGLAFRPLLWDWKLVGVTDVLAPINVASPVYPAAPDRNWGPSGLALADRWDLRRAIVLEARRRPDGGGDASNGARRIWYFDLQTLAPLYSIDQDADGATRGVAIHASRWSEDRAGYPRWPDDPARPVRVLDSAAAVYATPDGRGSWRRESWDFVATPPPEEELAHMRSIASITQGR